jgi:large subunit ribosomal protein L30
MAKTALKKIKIKLKKSLIGSSDSQRKVATSLGLSKINQTVEHFNSPTILGMVNKITHLLEVTE